jgi:Cys2His2 zinc finger developmental/cell cycle regulator
MVLSACSTYFEQLFLEHPEPNPIVIMRETSYTDLAIIVEFMYKGEINVSQVRYLSHQRPHVASSQQLAGSREGLFTPK